MEIAEEIRALEERLLENTVRSSREAVVELLAEDFLEFGKSGRVFDRDAILAELQNESPILEHWLDDFEACQLGDDVVLVTYRIRAARDDGASTSLRSSIWVRRGDRWQMVFHQGTLKHDG